MKWLLNYGEGTKQRLRLASRSFALTLLGCILVGAFTVLIGYFRHGRLDVSARDAAGFVIIALAVSVALTVAEQAPLWRKRIPSKRRR